MDGFADLLWALASLAQRDGQVLGPVGLQQGHLVGALLRGLLLAQGHVHRRPLGFGLEHLLKLIHVQVLEGSDNGIKFNRLSVKNAQQLVIFNMVNLSF